MPSAIATRRHLLTASALWLLLLGAILYLSLFPLSDWALRRPSPWHWLLQGLPRFYSYGDLIVNLVAYGGFGFLSVRLCQQRLTPGSSLIVAFLAGTLLSFGMETAQSFLPRRVPSLLDLAANSSGTLLGALAARFMPRQPMLGLLTQGDGHGRSTHFQRHQIMAALLLLVWLIGQFAPQPLPWVSVPLSPWPGEAWLRAVLPAMGGIPADWQPLGEALLICLSVLLPALLVGELIRSPNLQLLGVYALLALAFVARVMASPHIYQHSGPWEIHTRGLPAGLGLAAILLVLLVRWPACRRRTAALWLIPVTMLLALCLPPDPGLTRLLDGSPSSMIMKAATPAFRSLLRIISSFWPLALAYHFLLEAAGALTPPPDEAHCSLSPQLR